MSMDFNEVVPEIQERVADHEKRLKRLEKALAEKLSAQDIEQMIEDRYPQMAPEKPKAKG